jgi:tetrapyrrole methylase family protein/MazG family protein
MQLDKATAAFVQDIEGTLMAEYGAIIRRLRSPDGCPWDRKQTLQSLRRFLLEESMETIAAIDDLERGTKDERPALLQEIGDELGDVLLIFHLLAHALSQVGGPTVEDIVRGSGEKLVRRHPHVFGEVVAKDSATVVKNWHQIKQQEEGKSYDPQHVSQGLHPLDRAFEMQKKAATLGFDWDDFREVREKVSEELRELDEEIAQEPADKQRIEAELGDAFFAMVNLSRHLKVHPSLALAGVNERFVRRFSYIQEQLNQKNMVMESCSLEVLDSLWEEAKSQGF